MNVPKAPEQGRQFITHTRTGEGFQPRNLMTPGGWLHPGGAWRSFAEGYRSLVALARPEHLVDGHLKRVQVGGFVGEKRVYMWPTHPTDPDGIEVKRSSSGISLNIAAFLATIKYRPEVGIAQRFDLVAADQDSPVQPALMIYLNKPLETKNVEKKKGNTRSQASGDRSQPSGEGSQAAGDHSQAAGDRPQASGNRLQASGNRPRAESRSESAD